MGKQNKPSASTQNAQQTFRQFAWNLAGTLANGKGADEPASTSGRKR